MLEIWRNIPGSGGKYQVSIETKEGKCRNTNYRNTGKARIFKSAPNKKDGRIRWTLHINGLQVCQQAAVWIALAFPELVQNEYFEGAQIDHIDADPLNNHPSNLRWVTPKENMSNPLTKILISHIRKGKTPSDATKTKLSQSLTNRPDQSKPVNQYDLSGVFITYYPSAKEAERQNSHINVSHEKISLCCKGKRKKHKGYIWKYV